MNIAKKYLNLIVAAIPVVTLPLGWYFCMVSDTATLEIVTKVIRGWEGMLYGWGLVLIIYLFCLFAQYMACTRGEMYRIFAICSQVIFVWIVTVGFFMSLKREQIAITMMLKAKIIGFREGYYLCIGAMVVSVVLNIIGYLKEKNKENDA